jgi:hypothetical protein
MKKAILVVAQFVMFYVVFFVGSLLDPFLPVHPRWFIQAHQGVVVRYFVPDGLVAVVLLYLLVLAVEAVRNRINTAGAWTTMAFVAALGLGLLSKFGWVTP